MENTKKQFMEDWKFVVMGRMKGTRKWHPMKINIAAYKPTRDALEFVALEEATKANYAQGEASQLQFYVDYADELNADMTIKLELTYMGDE